MPAARRPSRHAFLAAALAVLAGGACSLGCPGLGQGGTRSITVVSYNAMNLFDARDQGGEYPEFTAASGRWDEARYRARLGNLARAVGAGRPDGAAPDVLCLLEIENRRVADDLVAGPLAKAGYASVLMAPAAGSAVNSAILSRLPFRRTAAHALALGGGPGERAGRHILEAELAAGGSALTLILCHWKSRIEGAEATEGARRAAAGLTRDLVARALARDPNAAVVVCGDFNESPDEYARVSRRYPTALFPAAEAGLGAATAEAGLGAATAEASAKGSLSGSAAAGAGSAVGRLLVAFERSGAGFAGGEPVLYSPWAESSGYSYMYRGQRERLDGFLLSAGLIAGGGSIAYRGFSALDAPFLLGADGAPLPWTGSSASGFSDHLPVSLALEAAAK